jgi:hypothetical protein
LHGESELPPLHPATPPRKEVTATVELLASPEAWIAFVTLTKLEIVLGVDNIVFIAILAGRLPAEQRKSARQIGLARTRRPHSPGSSSRSP